MCLMQHKHMYLFHKESQWSITFLDLVLEGKQAIASFPSRKRTCAYSKRKASDFPSSISARAYSKRKASSLQLSLSLCLKESYRSLVFLQATSSRKASDHQLSFKHKHMCLFQKGKLVIASFHSTTRKHKSRNHQISLQHKHIANIGITMAMEIVMIKEPLEH